MSEAPEAPAPLGPIAICLSGGGFRAAGFHLGALALLHDVDLLDQVGMVSMVSGGALVGGAWLHARARGDDFDAFYLRFSQRLRDERLMGAAVAAARAGDDDRGFSLIRAMADVYDRTIFEGATFGDLRGGPKSPSEVLFNATEFDDGGCFRFLLSSLEDAPSGCEALPVPEAVRDRLRLADVVAASACFPGGFEPLVFPDDFGVSPDQVSGRVALMDGGIYDNQGIDALSRHLARQGAPQPGLVILSDSAQAKDQIYRSEPSPRSGGLRLRTLYYAGLTLSVLLSSLLLTQALALLVAGHPWFAAFDLALAALTAAPGLALRRLSAWLGDTLAEAVPQVPLGAAAELRLHDALAGTSVRLRSLSALTGNVFLRRVRELVYKRFYEDKKLRGKRISNLIYRVPMKTTAIERLAALGWLRPEAIGLPGDVDQVKSFATTLWFWEPEQLERLVRVGYASMCFNLGEHLLLRYGEDPSAWPEEARRVFKRCQDIWNAGARRVPSTGTSPAIAPMPSAPRVRVEQ